MSLAKLTEKLLYNSIIEVWIALCNDLNYDWQNLKMFNSFIRFFLATLDQTTTTVIIKISGIN